MTSPVPDTISEWSRSATASSASRDRKSTRLNSSHDQISYAVFCLKKKRLHRDNTRVRFRHARLSDPLFSVATWNRLRHTAFSHALRAGCCGDDRTAQRPLAIAADG